MQVAEAEFEAIVNALSGLADGGSVSRIGEALGETMPRRTLQRRLAVLVVQGRLVREGPRARHPVSPSCRAIGTSCSSCGVPGAPSLASQQPFQHP